MSIAIVVGGVALLVLSLVTAQAEAQTGPEVACLIVNEWHAEEIDVDGYSDFAENVETQCGMIDAITEGPGSRITVFWHKRLLD